MLCLLRKYILSDGQTVIFYKAHSDLLSTHTVNNTGEGPKRYGFN